MQDYTNISQLPRTFSYDLRVTPTLAYSLLHDGMLYEAHRGPINPATIAFLREQIRKDDFVDGLPLILVSIKEKLYLGNGRHTMSAMIQQKHTSVFRAFVFELPNRKAIPKQIWKAHLEVINQITQFASIPGFESYVQLAFTLIQ